MCVLNLQFTSSLQGWNFFLLYGNFCFFPSTKIFFFNTSNFFNIKSEAKIGLKYVHICCCSTIGSDRKILRLDDTSGLRDFLSPWFVLLRSFYGSEYGFRFLAPRNYHPAERFIARDLISSVLLRIVLLLFLLSRFKYFWVQIENS